MKKSILLITLLLALFVAAFAKGQNSGARQRTGSASRGNHSQNFSSHNQYGQTRTKGQMNGSHQKGSGQMGGAQQMGHGNMGQGNQGPMNQNGYSNGSSMGNGGPNAGSNRPNGMMQGQSGTTQQP